MLHQIVISLINAMMPVVGSAVLAGLGWLIGKYVHNKTVADALTHGVALAKVIVASTEQTVVADLKKTGSWNSATMKTVAADAAATLATQVKIALPQALQLVEAAVQQMPSAQVAK